MAEIAANGYKIREDQKLNRLAIALAALATEIDLRDDEYEAAGIRREPDPPRMSAEEQIERILYVEHFTWTHVPKGGVW